MRWRKDRKNRGRTHHPKIKRGVAGGMSRNVRWRNVHLTRSWYAQTNVLRGYWRLTAPGIVNDCIQRRGGEMKSDWGFIIMIIVIIVVGVLLLGLLQKHYVDDMDTTCTKCLETCRPQSNEEAFAICKVCWMSPINGEYLDYKNPTCKPVPRTAFQRLLNLSGG